MFSSNTSQISSGGPIYVEDVYSTFLYTGNGGNLLLENGVALNTQSEQLFATPGTYTRICPAGVTSVSVVCIGAGGNERENGSGAYYGGAGGGLGYKNNISVTPGTSYTVIVGAAEGSSEFKLGATGLVGASGGIGQTTRGAPLYGSSGGLGGYGGGDNIGDYSGGGGGGGAGGYTGNGGDGGAYGGSGPTLGTGGGYGGNAGGYGGGGYGVNVYGPAAQQTPTNPYFGGSYGGGSPGSDSSTNGGGTGAVRIIWPGTTRQFPSTLVAQGTTSNGGFVWLKNRSLAANHVLVSDVPALAPPFRTGTYLSTNNTSAYVSSTTTVPFFTSNGFQVGSNVIINTNGQLYSSWAFKKQPKFSDVVQFNTSIVYNPETGEPIAGGDATVTHDLQSLPGFIIIRRLGGSDWYCYHRSLGTSKYILLNSTAAAVSTTLFASVTATQFSVTGLPYWGDTFEGWLFAHDAAGFGLTGADNVISCGSFTTDASGNGTFQNLGYEPQWILVKNITSAEDWVVADTMRGMYANPASSNMALFPNTSGAETLYGLGANISSTGFTGFGSGSKTYIYIAIRRGPMKVPTSASNYFAPVTRVGNGGNPTISGGITDDAAMIFRRPGSTSTVMVSRLTANPYLETVNTNAQNTDTLAFPTNTWDVQQGLKLGGSRPIVNSSGVNYIDYHLRRAPKFFDEVCWSADGSGGAITLNHNLTVTPELLFYKRRSGGAGNWFVYAAPLGLNGSLNLNNSDANPGYGRVSAVTATTFTTDPTGNISGATYIARLFATCPGVSKVGSYVGSSSDVTVDCGFTSGARFVLIRRILFGTTPDTGNWWVFDSARGMTTTSDPAFLLNSTAAEFSGNYVDQTATGFVAKTGNSETNAANQTYIYLAIA